MVDVFAVLFIAFCILGSTYMCGHAHAKETWQKQAVERGYGQYIDEWSEPDSFTPGGWHPVFHWNSDMEQA